MKAEIICIGTELLMGQIVNTNAQFFASELHELGIDSYFQTTVGDNEKRIHEVLELALKRSDIIITSGGLGPTSDDLTHESIASYFNVKPTLDKKVLSEIEKKFSSRGYKKMPAMNKKQAYKPIDAKWIPNENGTARGIIWDVGRESLIVNRISIREGIRSTIHNPQLTILTFPGVPSELYSMWNETAKPYLKKISGGNSIFSRTLKFTGIGESALAEMIEPVFDLKNPTVAPYAGLGEVKIRVTSKSKNLAKAKKDVLKTCKSILLKTKDYYFGDDEESLEEIVGKLLIAKKKSIALAESCTGGFLSKRLTDVAGSSKYIKLNLVTYANEAKNKMLNVPDEILKEHGSVSPQVAFLMAKGIKDLASADMGFSITGVAGPSGGSKEKPVGLVYFAIAYGNKVKVEKKQFSYKYSRADIRWLATQFALNWIRESLMVIR
jgi:nicotinamide-nucleotide amidase